MGIDCYMYWNGMTKEDEEKQITGYSIDAGDVGYLRVAYNEWMKHEHNVFNRIFPRRVMESSDEAGEPYNFKRNIRRVAKLLTEYVKQNVDSDISQTVMWANSVLQFFYLGMEKQENGLNPKVHVSG